MKLKDWGFMRHKPRKATADRHGTVETSPSNHEEGDLRNRESSGTVEPMSIEITPLEACEKQGTWQAVAHADVEAEPTFMSLLGQSREYVY